MFHAALDGEVQVFGYSSGKWLRVPMGLSIVVEIWYGTIVECIKYIEEFSHVSEVKRPNGCESHKMLTIAPAFGA